MTDKARYDGRYPEPPYVTDQQHIADLEAELEDACAEQDRLRKAAHGHFGPVCGWCLQTWPRGLEGHEACREHALSCPENPVVKEIARLREVNAELLGACKAQHDAIDALFAMMIGHCSEFFPSKSGQPWEAMLQGNRAIARAAPHTFEAGPEDRCRLCGEDIRHELHERTA